MSKLSFEVKMNLIQLLEQRKAKILNQATDALARSHLAHYDAVSIEQNQARLNQLYDIMVQCIQARDLTAMVNYAEELAQERFLSGYDLHEVQTAFNVLEEAIWKQIIQECPPSELAEALGLVSTVHGLGKDTFARQYVSLACKTKTTTLNLSALFNGTNSGLGEDEHGN